MRELSYSDENENKDPGSLLSGPRGWVLLTREGLDLLFTSSTLGVCPMCGAMQGDVVFSTLLLHLVHIECLCTEAHPHWTQLVIFPVLKGNT